ncbi:putative pentatricopeptide repeat protein [Rosellinia necatrix]|uniref:Putative pentatricopeptide repeat protein n=1 Tax=Rosellinia necatrix TaxID=77044 RepID=A0A1W2TDB5_ROSNE|nr:putative pentatricopeptide repeat protein [Rosellinia necatrix]
MLGDRVVVVDGLWRCLCPSIDIPSLSKPFHLWHVPRARPASSFTDRNTVPNRSQQQCRRRYSQASSLPGHKVKPNDEPNKSRAAYLKRLAKRSPWVPGAVFQDPDAFNATLDKIPTRNLYATLKELQNAEDAYVPVTRLVEYLVQERGERPNSALYEGLIKANVDKQYGSAKAAGQLLKEVQSHNMPTTTEFYQALLEVTAVHPDYVLRAQVLHDMKNRWYGLTPSTEVSIIIGLLRDGQHELALFKLEELNRVPINVPQWLFDVFLYTFGDLGFHEETLAVLKHRQKVVNVLKRAPLSLNAWQFLLEVFSRDSFHPGIKFIWDRSVSPGHIHPPDGVALNVLNAASAHGDTALAMGAIQELSARGIKLGMHHYEALIHVHMRHDDLRKALTVLCIMAKAGVTPELASTRPIFQMLRASPASTDMALSILHELKAQYTIPAAAFNVVLESTAAHEGFRSAFDLYRTIRQVCIKGPDLETFGILFRYCTQRKSMSFLVAEMEAFSLKITKPIFDHLIRICSMQDDYEMAFRYVEMMRTSTPPGLSETWWMSKSSALALLRRCIQARDPRFEGLLGECRRRRLLDDDDVKSLISVGAQRAGVLRSQPSPSDSLEHGPHDSARQPVPSSISG